MQRAYILLLESNEVPYIIIPRPDSTDVRDKALRPHDADIGEHSVEFLPGCADKWSALPFFLLSGGLSDEHDSGGNRP